MNTNFEEPISDLESFDMHAGHGPVSPERLEIGDFTIDVRNRMVMIQGREIPLDQAELDLLIFLTTNRRKIVTPRTLLITRWTNQKARQEDFLPILLSLRKKLETEIPSQHYIRVEPWILCRFEPSVQ